MGKAYAFCVCFISGIITKSTIWDKLVFQKVQDLLGGRVKAIVTGAAPISPPVLRFLRLAFGATVRICYMLRQLNKCLSLKLCGVL